VCRPPRIWCNRYHRAINHAYRVWPCACLRSKLKWKFETDLSPGGWLTVLTGRKDEAAVDRIGDNITDPPAEVFPAQTATAAPCAPVTAAIYVSVGAGDQNTQMAELRQYALEKSSALLAAIGVKRELTPQVLSLGHSALTLACPGVCRSPEICTG
jgi:hypothetical protein